MLSRKSFAILFCSLLAAVFFILGMILMMGGAGSKDPDVKHRQSIGVWLTMSGSIVILGMMASYVACNKKRSEQDFAVI